MAGAVNVGSVVGDAPSSIVVSVECPVVVDGEMGTVAVGAGGVTDIAVTIGGAPGFGLTPDIDSSSPPAEQAATSIVKSKQQAKLRFRVMNERCFPDCVWLLRRRCGAARRRRD